MLIRPGIFQMSFLTKLGWGRRSQPSSQVLEGSGAGSRGKEGLLLHKFWCIGPLVYNKKYYVLHTHTVNLLLSHPVYVHITIDIGNM